MIAHKQFAIVQFKKNGEGVWVHNEVIARGLLRYCDAVALKRNFAKTEFGKNAKLRIKANVSAWVR